MRVLDAGCGGGRNLVYLLREGYEVFGVDASAEAVAACAGVGGGCLRRSCRAENFQVAAIEAMPFPDAFADVVVCNSVLHFARDEAHFDAMVRGALAGAAAGRDAVLPAGIDDWAGTDAFEAVGGAAVSDVAWGGVVSGGRGDADGVDAELGGELVDPLKTTVVQGAAVHDDVGGAEGEMKPGQSHLEFHGQWNHPSCAKGTEWSWIRGERETFRTAEITHLVHPDGISGGLAIKINCVLS